MLRKIFILIFLGNTLFAQISHNSTIKIKRYLANNSATIYLYSNKKVTDSLILSGLNFTTDSLLKTGDKWYYKYSLRCGSNCKLRRHIIIAIVNDKLQIQFAGTAGYSLNIDNQYIKNSTVTVTDYSCSYNLKFKNQSLFVNEKVYVKGLSGVIKKEITDYEVKFNEAKKIFSNHEYILAGKYTVNSGGQKKEVTINSSISGLKFKETCWLFYKGKWYEYLEEKRALIAF